MKADNAERVNRLLSLFLLSEDQFQHRKRDERNY